jgi:hypothetical protein
MKHVREAMDTADLAALKAINATLARRGVSRREPAR